MKTLMWLVAIILASTGPACAQGSLPVPWAELRQMIRQNMTCEQAEKRIPPEKMVYSLTSGRYRLALDRRRARGQMILSGMVISGDLGPIRLLARTPAIETTSEVSGGHLLPLDGGLAFLPADHGPFKVALSFALPLTQDGRELVVDLPVAPALQNALAIDPSDELMLSRPPGIASSDGSFLFTADDHLSVHFTPTTAGGQRADLEVASVSVLAVKGRQLALTTILRPLVPVTAPLVVSIPKGFSPAAGALDRSAAVSEDGRTLTIHWSAPAQRPRSLAFLAPLPTDDATVRFRLPQVKGNLADEGLLWLKQPENGRLDLDVATPSTTVSGAHLHPDLKAYIAGGRRPLMVDPQKPIGVSLRRYKTAETPPTVLRDVAFFVAFEENGHTLSVLRMSVPAGAGDHLFLQAPALADIWSLSVNGQRRQVFSTPDGQWMLPIDDNRPSAVELVFHRKGSKVGLHGRLAAHMPSTGLPCSRLTVGIALPRRVELLSLDGPVSPAQAPPDNVPPDFIGRPYFFTRAFYPGDPLVLDIAYREPAGDRSAAGPNP